MPILLTEHNKRIITLEIPAHEINWIQVLLDEKKKANVNDFFKTNAYCDQIIERLKKALNSQ